MRCKRHPCEQGCNGVCAFCLSERLSALQAVSEEEWDDRQESDHTPPSSSSATTRPALSLSASRRRPCSAAGRWDPSHSAPRAGPADRKPKAKRHKKRGRLSSFFLLFRRSKSRGKDPPPPPPSVSKARIAPSSSPWISAFRRKKKSRLFSVDDEIAAAGSRKACRTTINRGLSPVTSPYASPDSPEASKKAAAGAVDQKARRRKRARHLSKLAVCLSPLVRAKPRRCHRHESFFPCKFRGGNWHSRSTAPSLCPNRSRKIADLGRNH